MYETTLRPMTADDIDRVIDIIAETDKDDAETAASEFANSGLNYYFVLELDGSVIGVSGYSVVEATERTAWLSWTYLLEEYRGKGLGKKMVADLIQQLTEFKCRKLFVKISDYNCPENGAVYESAYQLYLSLGFTLELTANEFYDQGENLRILSLDVCKPDEETPLIKDELPQLVFDGLFEIADTDDAYTFSWTVPKALFGMGKRCFTANDLALGLQEVKNREGRKVFLTFPSNLPMIHEPLLDAGFKMVGKLVDFYEPGLDELHFSHDLTNLS